MRRSGVWYIDRVLGGGFREGRSYGIYGEPWKLVKEILHVTTTHLAAQGKTVIVYGQYFEGLDPYKIVRIAEENSLDIGIVKKNLRIARCFKGEDVIDNIRRVSKIDAYIVIVDPYLHTYMTGKKELYPGISSEIYKMKVRGRTVIVFNRLRWDGKPLGGHLHRHSMDYIVTFEPIDKLLHIELVKAVDMKPDRFAVDISGRDRRIQYLLDRWV